ncbi:MAG: histone, partial [Comamonadaceae bacterium]
KAVAKKAPAKKAPAKKASTPAASTAPGAKTALNPAASWPFPTGSRP